MFKKLFGLHLQELRKQHNVTQEKLAEAVDVSVMTVRRWEHGEFGPEFDRLDQIAEALSIPVIELFDF